MKESNKTNNGSMNAHEPSRQLKSINSISTLDEKIGKVISEIKQLNMQKAQRYGICETIGDSCKTR